MNDQCTCCGDLVARFEMNVCSRCGSHVCEACTIDGGLRQRFCWRCDADMHPEDAWDAETGDDLE